LYGSFVYTTKMMFLSLPPPGRIITIVSIITTNNGCTCGKHHFGCGKSLLLARPARGCGAWLRLRRIVALDKLMASFVLWDCSDGCRVEFTPRKHAVGAHGSLLDGVLVRVFEVFTPEHTHMLKLLMKKTDHLTVVQ
jgi:hypothetical protein